MEWIIHHYKLIADLVKTVLGWKKSWSHAPSSTLTAQGAKVTNSPVASGTNISQTINSPTVNLSLPAKMPTTDEDQSSWPDVILECQWPSLVHESRIPGSHTVRNRPWILRYRGPGAVYDVCVHRIGFGAYKALFPFPVRTLTDTASVHPIICRKSDGLMITTHDLESLIHNPPSGCDVQQYAVETDGNESEEIFEVEVPVCVSYDDKNGNQFRIEYLLHYDIHMREGEMIRIGRIEKVE